VDAHNLFANHGFNNLEAELMCLFLDVSKAVANSWAVACLW